MECISNPKNVKARKDHKCDFCLGVIKKGDYYNTATYKSDDIYRHGFRFHRQLGNPGGRDGT